VDRLIVRDATKLTPGRVFYTPWCDEHGKVLDDGTIRRLDDEDGAQVVRWTAADPQVRWLRMNARGLDVEVRDVSESVAAVTLQGPLSRDVLEAATGASFADLRYFRRRRAALAGVPIDVSRTGYTGDLGCELWIPADRAVQAWDALVAAGEPGRVRPAGMLALDVVRLEAGLILIEADYTSAVHSHIPSQNYSPYEIGLGRLVDLAAGDFISRRALVAKLAAGGPPRRLVGLTSSGRRSRRSTRHRAWPRTHPDREPHAGPDLRRRPPGRARHQHRLEPDPQEDAGPRLGRARACADRDAPRDGVDGRGPAGHGRGQRGGPPVLRPAAQARLTARNRPSQTERYRTSEGPAWRSATTR
jgi:glycine cleavage system aminomethyltransferase T